MTSEFMRDLLTKDEKITVKYKSCQIMALNLKYRLLL